MPQVPKLIPLSIDFLVTLLSYYRAALKTPSFGDLGMISYQELIERLDKRSIVKIEPAELESLLFIMKTLLMNSKTGYRPTYRIKEYVKMTEDLKQLYPFLFKELPHGEISMIDFKEDLEDDDDERGNETKKTR